MLDQKVKKHIDSARQILVGKIPDPKAQVEQITTAMIYKFMQDMDLENVELGGKAKYFVGDLKKYSWSHLISKELSGHERMDLYVRALVEFSKSKKIPELFRSIFKDTFLPYRDPETLTLFLKEINEFTYENSENLGNAFEYLLSILGSQGDAGQFRTPRHIIDFIVEVVDPKKNETILDPACGTAGFLISAYKHIRRIYSSNFKEDDYIPTFAETDNRDITTVEIQKNGKYKGDKLTPDDRKKLAKNIVGYDISPDMVRLSLVNLYLHNFSSPKIFEYDSLTYEDRWDETFDVILANPPFMTPKGGIRPHKRFQVQANRAEVLFVDYIAEHLKINGRAGIIVPEGIIFQTATAYKSLRKMLVENELLWAVVSLPSGVFNPYSGVKTSILFLDKEIAKKSDEILFVKVENDGFDLGSQRRRIDKNDLPKAFDILKKQENHIKKKGEALTYGEVRGMADIVRKEEIAADEEYNLSIDRYRKDVSMALRENILNIEEVLKPHREMFKSFSRHAEKYKKQIEEMQKSIEPFVRYIQNQQEAISEINKNLNEPIKKIQKAFESINFSSLLKEIEDVRDDINKDEWPMIEIGKVCEIYNGSTPKRTEKKYWENGNIPWFTVDDIREQGRIISYTKQKITEAGLKESSVKLLPKNSVLLCCTASIGEYAFTEIELTTNQQFNGLVVKDEYIDKLDPKFLFYLMSNLKDDLDRLSGKTSFGFVSVGSLKKIKIPLPPIGLQKKLVIKLDQYQKVINGAKQVIDNWSPNIKINSEWKMIELGDSSYFTIESGGTPSSQNKKYWNGDIKWVTLVDLPPDDLISEVSSTKRMITRDGLKNSSAKIIPENSILVSSRATIGRIGINKVPLATNQGFKNIIINDFKKVNEKFVALMIYFSVPQMNDLASGGTFKEISKSSIAKIKIPLPSLEIQNKIVNELKDEEKLVNANKNLVNKLKYKIDEEIKSIWNK